MSQLAASRAGTLGQVTGTAATRPAPRRARTPRCCSKSQGFFVLAALPGCESRRSWRGAAGTGPGSAGLPGEVPARWSGGAARGGTGRQGVQVLSPSCHHPGRCPAPATWGLSRLKAQPHPFWDAGAAPLTSSSSGPQKGTLAGGFQSCPLVSAERCETPSFGFPTRLEQAQVPEVRRCSHASAPALAPTYSQRGSAASLPLLHAPGQM